MTCLTNHTIHRIYPQHSLWKTFLTTYSETEVRSLNKRGILWREREIACRYRAPRKDTRARSCTQHPYMHSRSSIPATLYIVKTCVSCFEQRRNERERAVARERARERERERPACTGILRLACVRVAEARARPRRRHVQREAQSRQPARDVLLVRAVALHIYVITRVPRDAMPLWDCPQRHIPRATCVMRAAGVSSALFTIIFLLSTFPTALLACI